MEETNFFVFPSGEASANAFILFLRVSGDEVVLKVFLSDQMLLLSEAVYRAVLLLICFHEFRQFHAKNDVLILVGTWHVGVVTKLCQCAIKIDKCS